MSGARGFQAIAGIKKETTLGTVVAVTSKLNLISESLTANYAHIQNQALIGGGARRRSIQGARQAGGQLVLYWDYALQQPLFEQFFGTWADNDPDDDTYTLDDTIDGKGVSLAIEKQVSVHEFAGVKIGQLVISGNNADGVRVTADCFPKTRSLVSSTNTTAVLAALAEAADPMLFHDSALWIGDLANDLTSGDAVEIESFTLTINRNMVQKQVNSTTLREAKENGFQDITLSINLAEYDADTFINWHEAHTTLQAKLAFSDGTNSKRIHMPQLLVTGANPVFSGPELIGYTVSFSVHGNLDAANDNDDFDFVEALTIFED